MKRKNKPKPEQVVIIEDDPLTKQVTPEEREKAKNWYDKNIKPRIKR